MKEITKNLIGINLCSVCLLLSLFVPVPLYLIDRFIEVMR